MWNRNQYIFTVLLHSPLSSAGALRASWCRSRTTKEQWRTEGRMTQHCDVCAYVSLYLCTAKIIRLQYVHPVQSIGGPTSQTTYGFSGVCQYCLDACVTSITYRVSEAVIGALSLFFSLIQIVDSVTACVDKVQRCRQCFKSAVSMLKMSNFLQLPLKRFSICH